MRWIFRSGVMGVVGLMLVAMGPCYATAATLPVGSWGVTLARRMSTARSRAVWSGAEATFPLPGP